MYSPGRIPCLPWAVSDWQYNGHLRFFNTTQRNWEIVPINQKLPVLKSDPGNHYDYNNGLFFYLDQKRLADQGLITSTLNALTHESSLPSLFVLDMKTKT